MSSEGIPFEASQLGHRGGRDSNTSASHRDYGGGSGTGFCDKHVAIDESSSKIHVA